MRTTRTRILMAAALASLLLSALTVPAAQAQAVDGLAANGASVSSAVDTPGPDQNQAAPTAAKPAPASGGNWRVDATGYLWLAGTHGNFSAFSYDLGFKASIGDLLSKARFGLMGIVDVRYKRLVLTPDVMWLTLSDTNTKTIPLPGLPQISSELVSRTVIFTQKVGIRLIDTEAFKMDASAGFRFWHLGNTLTVTPSPQGNNFYKSKNWVDPLIGARFQFPFSPIVMATIAGDVGGWGAGSQVDYQIAGVLTCKVSPKMALNAGYRYLYLDYGKNNIFSTQAALSGPILGMTYTFQRAN